ncbi:MAG: intradiol ring-cleavage dioxygenase [Bacteroidia bacterium]|nr:intradiol ring-cleavage dioxygenase [Bacteroidia bacterium]
MKSPQLIGLFLVSTACYGQQVKQAPDQAIADYCDGCEMMYEGISLLNNISWEASLANKGEPGASLEIIGTVYMLDGKTPAKDIVLYVYHTDAKGLYSGAQGQVNGTRHGHLRGWVKTNELGQFKIKSIRPAPYPNGNIPAHLHLLVKEPNKTLYYIDEVWFEDDPLVTTEMKRKAEKRGGNLTIPLTKEGNGWRGILKITLGLNIPNYH